MLRGSDVHLFDGHHPDPEAVLQDLIPTNDEDGLRRHPGEVQARHAGAGTPVGCFAGMCASTGGAVSTWHCCTCHSSGHSLRKPGDTPSPLKAYHLAWVSYAPKSGKYNNATYSQHHLCLHTSLHKSPQVCLQPPEPEESLTMAMEAFPASGSPHSFAGRALCGWSLGHGGTMLRGSLGSAQ